MISLISLTCYNCTTSDGNRALFFNNTDRRPCYGSCGHAVCIKCVDAAPTMSCRICHVENAFQNRVVNFAVEGIIEDYQERCVEMYKKWWGLEMSRESCPKCHYQVNSLRICIQCNNSLIYHENNALQIYLFDPQFIFRICNHIMCADCAIDAQCHPANNFISTRTLENFESEIKKCTAPIIRDLLKEQLEKWAELGTCKLQLMRIQWISEVLHRFATTIYPHLFPDAQAEALCIGDNDYGMILSKVSKYLEPMDWELDRDGARDGKIANIAPEKLLDALEFQRNEYQNSEPCKCSTLWKRAQEMHFVNELESQYARILMDVGLVDQMRGCLMERDCIVEELVDGFEKKFPFKSHLLTSVFCWNRFRGSHCQIFDSALHKPCPCRRCGNSTCERCIQTNFNIKCSFCELDWVAVKSHDHYEIDENDCTRRVKEDKKALRKMKREYEHDEHVLELVEFCKEHPVEVYEEWWKSKETGSGYCMKCRSYSEQLEICVLCELDHPQCAIKSTETGFEFVHSTSISRLSPRLQCSGCSIRLSSALELQHSVLPKELEHLDIPMFRGCNHRSRVSKGCSKYDNVRVDDEKFTASVMKLKDIKKSEWIVKWSNMEVANKVLRGGWNGKEEVLDELKGKVREFFEKVLGDEVNEGVAVLKEEIDNLIEMLKN